jgi:hypothetical protein
MFFPRGARVSAEAAELMIKVAVLIVVAFARTWVVLLGVSGLIALFWFLYKGEALRFLVSFILKWFLL